MAESLLLLAFWHVLFRYPDEPVTCHGEKRGLQIGITCHPSLPPNDDSTSYQRSGMHHGVLFMMLFRDQSVESSGSQPVGSTHHD